MAKEQKIKLTFVRKWPSRSLTPLIYELAVIEGAENVSAEETDSKKTTKYRVGDSVPAAAVQAFCECRRDFEVRVKS